MPAFLLALLSGASAVVARLASLVVPVATLGAGVVSLAYGAKILLSVGFIFFVVIPAILVIQGQLYTIWAE